MEKGLIIPACKCPQCKRLTKGVKLFVKAIREQYETFRIAALQRQGLSLTPLEVNRIWDNISLVAWQMGRQVSGCHARKIQQMTDDDFEKYLSDLWGLDRVRVVPSCIVEKREFRPEIIRGGKNPHYLSKAE